MSETLSELLQRTRVRGGPVRCRSPHQDSGMHLELTHSEYRHIEDIPLYAVAGRIRFRLRGTVQGEISLDEWLAQMQFDVDFESLRHHSLEQIWQIRKSFGLTSDDSSAEEDSGAIQGTSDFDDFGHFTVSQSHVKLTYASELEDRGAAFRRRRAQVKRIFSPGLNQ